MNFKQTYKETCKIENDNLTRDLELLKKVSKDQYIFIEVKEKELQHLGIDFLGMPRENLMSTEEYIFIDRKTSSKSDRRNCFVFELYFKYEGKNKIPSWSLQYPKTNNTAVISFIDKKQVVNISRKRMVKVLKLLEQERPDLIRVTEEYNKKNNLVRKYIVTLPVNHKYFLMMEPKMYGFDKIKRIKH